MQINFFHFLFHRRVYKLHELPYLKYNLIYSIFQFIFLLYIILAFFNILKLKLKLKIMKIKAILYFLFMIVKVLSNELSLCGYF